VTISNFKQLTLPAKYILPTPQCSVDETDGTSAGDTICTFIGIDSPNNADKNGRLPNPNIAVNILGFDCITTYDATLFGNTTVTANTVYAKNINEFNAVANVDPSSSHEGDVKFCIRTDLMDESGEIMIYRSERITVKFVYDGSFSVAGFSTTPYDGISNTDTAATKSFGVTAVRCDSRGYLFKGSPTLAIGENLFICIEANDVGPTITSINTFTATKAGTTPLVIDNSSSNVVIIGLGSAKLMAVISFPARFFAGVSPILLSGSVEIKSDNSRRLLSTRALEETTSEVSSDDATFALFIEVVADISSATGQDIMVAALFGVSSLLLV